MKKCYRYRGKKYGVDNFIETQLGKIYVMELGFLRLFLSGVVLTAVGKLGSFIINKWDVTNVVFLCVLLIFDLLVAAYVIFGIVFEAWNIAFVKCRYASGSREEIEEHFKKMCDRHPGYSECMTGIMCIDDRYYYFEKSRKELRAMRKARKKEIKELEKELAELDKYFASGIYLSDRGVCMELVGIELAAVLIGAVFVGISTIVYAAAGAFSNEKVLTAGLMVFVAGCIFLLAGSAMCMVRTYGIWGQN